MTDLTPVPALSPVVQIETNTLALGGTGNPVNQQAQALLNRDAYRAQQIDSVAGDATAYTDALREDLETNGASITGYLNRTVKDELDKVSDNVYSVSKLGFGSGVTDDYPGLQALFTAVAASGGGEVVFDSNNNYRVSNTPVIGSNTTVRFTGAGYITLTQPSAGGQVLLVMGTAENPATNVRIYDVRLDGGNFGYPTGNAYGENGIAGTKCKDVEVRGGYVKNCRRGASNPVGTGGKAIQFEAGVEDILVDGVTAINCTMLCESGGVIDAVLPGDTFRRFRLVTYTNLKAFFCERLISVSHAISPPDTTVSSGNFVVDGVQAFNCGREVPVGTEKDFGLIVNDRASNCTIRNVDVFNEASYGAVSSAVRMTRGSNCVIENIRLSGDCDQIVSHILASGWGTTGVLQNNVFGPIYHKGTAAYAIRANDADVANLLSNCYEIYTDTISTGLFHASVQTATLSGRFVEATKDTVIEGPLSSLAAAFANTYPVAYKAYAGTVRVNGATITAGSGVHIFASVDNLQFQSNGSVAQTWSTGKVNTPLARRPVFADNAAAIAGGLAAGDEYRTATGVVMVRF